MSSGGIDYGTSSPIYWQPEDAEDTVRLGDRTVPRVVLVEIGTPPMNGRPMVFLRLEVIGDRPQCREVRFVSPLGDGQELRQSDLESLPIADVIERVFTLAAWPYSQSRAEWQSAVPDLRKAIRAARRGRAARKVNRAFLEQVADVYRRNVADRPTQTVAEAFGLAHSTAAEYVRRARADGLLPPTTSGKRKA